MVQMLDCTIREAPVEKFHVGDFLIKDFILRSELANIDIIECGFLKDGKFECGSNCFSSPNAIKSYIPNKVKGIMYVALMDYGRYDIDQLEPYDGTSIDGIRICFKYGEQDVALEAAKKVKEKGYKIFIQHVDTLSYTDIELLEFLDKVNDVEPFGYSIVDTFGSMYEDDMERVAMMVNYHLKKEIRLGFHAHNNMMLANSNAQKFVSLYFGKRDIIVDSSVLGCGRGAGNANTEIMAEYLNRKYGKEYNLNEILDLIDALMPSLKKKCTWGYSVPYFLSGLHGTHVYNANYLLGRHNIASKDLRAIIDELDNEKKRLYDYENLEKLYLDYFSQPVDDIEERDKIKRILFGRNVLVLSTGSSLSSEKEKIMNFIDLNNPVVIGVNYDIKEYKTDILFFSSATRYRFYTHAEHNIHPKIVITSNIGQEYRKGYEMVVSYDSIVRSGWRNVDSAMILLLRLLVSIGINEINLAGFDGFNRGDRGNYYKNSLVTEMLDADIDTLVKDNLSMLEDIELNNPSVTFNFVTESMYDVRGIARVE